MGKQTNTPVVGIEEPAFICFEDEEDLRTLIRQAAVQKFGLVRCHAEAAEVEADLVAAVIEGHRHIVLISDVQVCSGNGGDKGKAVSNSVCSRALSGELFGGADVRVDVVRISGLELSKPGHGVVGTRFLEKPFTGDQLREILGEAELNVLMSN